MEGKALVKVNLQPEKFVISIGSNEKTKRSIRQETVLTDYGRRENKNWAAKKQ